ncbi:MAG: hypothetical protein WAV16_02575 [Candidatus Moraniibacteriota bacterium]
MSNSQEPTKSSYTLAVQIRVLVTLLKDRKNSVEVAFAEFPTEEQIYEDELGATDTLLIKIQEICSSLLGAVADIDEFLDYLGSNKGMSPPLGPEEFKKIAEFGG